MTWKILFLSVNSSYSHSSFALPMLHSAAKNVQKWEWYDIECTTKEDYAEIAAKAAAFQPDLLACSLYIFNFDSVINILSRFHELCPDCRIVVGGPECSGDAAHEIIEKYPFIHTVFRGEAEGVFAEYLHDFPDSECRVIPEKNNALYEKWTEDFPVNDRFFNTNKAFVQVETSRGCPMGCKYCTSSNIPLRMKELSNVEKELYLLHSKGVKEIRLLDRTFNFPAWRGAALLKLFREKFPDIEFHLEIHPQFLNDEIKKELQNAPNLHIEAGIQSLDENVQRAIGRNSRKKEVVSGIKFLASCRNFETHVDLICGLPEQTLESVLNDVVELIKLKVDEIQLETLKILHGTPLEKETAAYGISYSPLPPYDVMQTAVFSAAEILYVRKLSRLLDLYHNHPALREAFRKLNFTTAEDIQRFQNFMLENNFDFKQLSDLKKRILYFIKFLKKYPSDAAAFEISKVWLAQGYPLTELPFGEIRRFEGELPINLVAETEALFAHRETRFQQLTYKNFVMNFAVNRHFKLNGAAFIWE